MPVRSACPLAVLFGEYEALVSGLTGAQGTARYLPARDGPTYARSCIRDVSNSSIRNSHQAGASIYTRTIG